MRRRILLPGPALLGFADAFDSAFGDPTTPRPYLRVRPASISGILLPFPCPHCDAVRPEVVGAQKRGRFTDLERGFSWCPACDKRYVLVLAGAPLVEALPPGATSAPAQVEGRVPSIVVEETDSALALVGAAHGGVST